MKQVKVKEICICREKNISIEISILESKLKQYIVDETLKFGTIIVKDLVELTKMKIYMKRFLLKTLNSTNVNQYLNYVVRKNQNNDIERSLQIKQTKLYLSEMDIEAILQIWSDALLGLSKIKMYDKYEIFDSLSIMKKLSAEDILTNQGSVKHDKVVDSIINNGYFEKEIEQIIKK